MARSIRSALREMGKLLAKLENQSNVLKPVPADWLRRTVDGDYVGPPDDADPAELKSYRTVLRMDATMC